ncbi:MAG: glutaminase [Muribaculaceae bacterium]|nr:glutaminase [Muribaculaceae bacterium]
MERKITIKDVEKAMNEAYEQNKENRDGAVDPRLAADADADSFGIAVVLTDGRTLSVGATKTLSPLGKSARLPLSVELLSQYTPEELTKKSGSCCAEKSACSAKPKIAFGAHSVRAVSAVAPQGDRDGKYQVLLDRILGLTDGEPVFNDELYKLLSEEASAMKMADVLADAGYTLYDDAEQSLDVYARLMSLQLTAEQLAVMGATIAADGRNPRSGVYAFDGSVAANVVGLMASRKLGKHGRRAWMMRTGLPATASFGGTVLAVIPGFGAVAAFSPRLCDNGVSIRAARAVAQFAAALGLNVYSSARVAVE